MMSIWIFLIILDVVYGTASCLLDFGQHCSIDEQDCQYPDQECILYPGSENGVCCLKYNPCTYGTVTGLCNPLIPDNHPCGVFEYCMGSIWHSYHGYCCPKPALCVMPFDERCSSSSSTLDCPLPDQICILYPDSNEGLCCLNYNPCSHGTMTGLCNMLDPNDVPCAVGEFCKSSLFESPVGYCCPYPPIAFCLLDLGQHCSIDEQDCQYRDQECILYPGSENGVCCLKHNPCTYGTVNGLCNPLIPDNHPCAVLEFCKGSIWQSSHGYCCPKPALCVMPFGERCSSSTPDCRLPHQICILYPNSNEGLCCLNYNPCLHGTITGHCNTLDPNDHPCAVGEFCMSNLFGSHVGYCCPYPPTEEEEKGEE